MNGQKPFFESLEPRALCASTGSIRGAVFIDRNNNGKFDAFDTQKDYMVVTSVFLDGTSGAANDQRDPNEPAR